MPKLKSRSSAKKKKRALRQQAYASESNAPAIKKMLPYA